MENLPICALATTHPIKGEIFSYINSTISCQQFYFHQGSVFHTKALFTTSTTATTSVGDGDKSKGSTELDNTTGHNCTMPKDKYTSFAILMLGLYPGLQKGTRWSKCSFLNIFIDNFVTLTNLDDVFLLDEPTEKQAITRLLAWFSLLVLGIDALIPAIIEPMWDKTMTCTIILVVREVISPSFAVALYPLHAVAQCLL